MHPEHPADVEIFVSCPTNRVSLRRAGGLALPFLSIASRIVASTRFTSGDPCRAAR